MKKIFSILVCVALISSCGVITKTRYGNGVKVELGNGLFAKREKTEELKAEKAVKVGKAPNNESIVISNSVVKNADLFKDDTGYATPQVFKGNKVSNTYQKAVQKIKNNVVKSPTKAVYNEYPIEKNALWAGILFYGGLVAAYIPILNIIAGLAVLIGFILAIVALGKIKQSGGLLRGKGLSISIIVIFGLIVLLTLYTIALIFTFF